MACLQRAPSQADAKVCRLLQTRHAGQRPLHPPHPPTHPRAPPIPILPQGIFVGISSGATGTAAERVASRLEAAGKVRHGGLREGRTLAACCFAADCALLLVSLLLPAPQGRGEAGGPACARDVHPHTHRFPLHWAEPHPFTHPTPPHNPAR